MNDQHGDDVEKPVVAEAAEAGECVTGPYYARCGSREEGAVLLHYILVAVFAGVDALLWFRGDARSRRRCWLLARFEGCYLGFEVGWSGVERFGPGADIVTRRKYCGQDLPASRRLPLVLRRKAGRSMVTGTEGIEETIS